MLTIEIERERNGRWLGELPELPGERPTLKDWGDHMTTLFPEVRLKKYLEMRGADGGPGRVRGPGHHRPG